ncbi:MAG: sugar ABC transporter ATP-binding protein [Candidatus Caldatribacteriaceae bacterium]
MEVFFGVPVLKNVFFHLSHGEVHALLGENGAGKSTLIKILSGAYTLDRGKIFLEGREIDTTTYNPEIAARMGIATIYQNFHLVPHLTVAENISLSAFPLSRFRFINWSKVRFFAEQTLQLVNLQVDPNAKVKNLTISQQQMLEIAIALAQKAKIIIMDEPTAAISRKETETLFHIIQTVKSQGVGIIYISHKLEEIKEIADTVTILRDGEQVGTMKVQDVDLSHVVNLMTGKSIQVYEKRRKNLQNEEIFRCESLSVAGKFDNISFSVQRGEIVGLTGLVGAGKTELARAIFGVDPLEKGRISIAGKPIRHNTPRAMVEAGVGYIPEDRDTLGLCLNRSVRDNITIVSHAKSSGISLNIRSEIREAQSFVERLQIRTDSLEKQVKYLSGGNKQKVILAKWFQAQCQFLILDEPTIGIDVGARQEIYRLIYNFVQSGERGVLFISSDLSEILNVADRILVMFRGKITAELEPTGLTKQDLMTYCLGLKRNALDEIGCQR